MNQRYEIRPLRPLQLRGKQPVVQHTLQAPKLAFNLNLVGSEKKV